MKKLFSIMLTLLLLLSSAMAEGFAPVNTPITIDGVRVAFFDAEGNYLQSMEKDGLLWVPLNALCENLGKTAEVQGQSVAVDGVRIGMFDEAGNFLMPQEVNGTVYVPAVAFCQSAGIDAAKTENGVAIIRAATAPGVQAAPAPTAEPEHPEYVAVDLNTGNFSKYFSYGISAENFRNWEEKAKVGYNTLYFQHWSCDYVLNVTAKTGYKFENVVFTVSRPGKSYELDAKGAKFSGLTMPQSGEMTRTEKVSGSYFQSWAVISKASDVFYGGTTLERVSGKIYIPWEDAQAELESKYQSAQKAMDEGNYQSAVNTYKALAENKYKDAAQLLLVAEEKLADQKAQKQKDNYAAAQAAFDNGDWDAAIKGFKALGDYEDSKAKLTAATENKNAAAYEKALAYEKDGQYAEAIAAFEALKDYKDSAQHLAACSEAKADQENRAAYEGAEKLEASGELVKAYDAFINLANFEDSAQRAEKLLIPKTCQQAENLMAEKKYAEAMELLTPYESTDAEAAKLSKTCFLRSLNELSGFNKDGLSFFIGNDKTGIMDHEGNVTWYEGQDTAYIIKTPYTWTEDLYLATTGQMKKGYLDTKGNWAIEPVYEAAQTEFHQGKALVIKADGQRYVIDAQGNELAKLPAKSGRTYKRYVGEDLVSFKENGKWGLINLKGKVVLKAKYERYDEAIMPFVNGLAPVIEYKGGKIYSGVINAKGKEVIKPGKHKYRNNYEDRKVPVILSENLILMYSKDEKYWEIVNTKDKKVNNEQYSKLHREGDLIVGPTGAMDLELNVVVPFTHQGVKVGYQSKVVALKKDGVWRLYNISDLGKPLMDSEADLVYLSPESTYIAWRTADEGWFIYDSEGNLIR